MTIVVGRLGRDGSAMKTLGERIKHARKQLPGRGPGGRMTQDELGDLVGINSNSVSRWERDVPEDPTLEKMERFARALGVREEWLRSGAGPMREQESSLDTSAADDVRSEWDGDIEWAIGEAGLDAAQAREFRDARRSLKRRLSRPALLVLAAEYAGPRMLDRAVADVPRSETIVDVPGELAARDRE